MIKGNKGEWSEIYALFKLLGDKQLYSGDENLEKIQNAIYPIVKILCSELNGEYEYSIQDDIVFISASKEQLRIPITRFQEQANLLLLEIKSKKSAAFSIPEIEDL